MLGTLIFLVAFAFIGVQLWGQRRQGRGGARSPWSAGTGPMERRDATRLAGAARRRAAGLGPLHRPGGGARRSAPGSRRSTASATSTTPAGSGSPTPATPTRGLPRRSPSRPARSSTPSRTSSTTSRAWSCTSDCRAPSLVSGTVRRLGSSSRTPGLRRSRRRSSWPSTPPGGQGSSPSAAASTAAPTAPWR